MASARFIDDNFEQDTASQAVDTGLDTSKEFDPQDFRVRMLQKGYDPQVVEEEIQRRRATRQAPGAVKTGALTTQEALKATGGLGAEGSEDIISAGNKVAAEEAQKELAGPKKLAGDVKLLEEGRQDISGFFRGPISLPAGRGGMFSPEAEAFDALRDTTAFSFAEAIAGQTGRAISDQDIKIFRRALPDRQDTNKSAQKKIKNTADQLENRLKAAGATEQEARQTRNQLLSGLGIATDDPKDQETTFEDQERQIASDVVGDTGFQQIEPGTEGIAFDQDIESGAEEERTLGQFGQNALNDVQENIEGILGIPQLVSSIAQDPSIAPEVGKAVITGVVDEYKNLIANPLETAFDHPVNTVLNVIPVIPAGKVGATRFASTAGKADDVAVASRLAQGTLGLSDEAAFAGRVLDTGEDVSSATRIAEKAVGASPGLRGNIASKTFSSAFIIPTKRARSLKPREVSNQMLDYGVTGSFDEMRATANKVTGKDGVLSEVTRNAVGDLQTEISMKNVIPSVKNTLNDITDLTRTEENRILRNIARRQTPGKEIGSMNSLDAFDLARDLENLGHQHLNTSTYLTKNIKNEKIGKAYLNAADEIKLSIEQAAKDQNVVARYKTPEVLNELESVSPKLADDFRKANTLREVRSLQSPFVKLNQMIDLTEQAANSAFQATGGRLAGRAGASIVGGLAGGGVAGPIGTIGGAVGGAILGPPAQAVIEATRPSVLTKTAGLIRGRP